MTYWDAVLLPPAPRYGKVELELGHAMELCRKSDVLYTQTPGSSTVLEKARLRPHTAHCHTAHCHTAHFPSAHSALNLCTVCGAVVAPAARDHHLLGLRPADQAGEQTNY